MMRDILKPILSLTEQATGYLPLEIKITNTSFYKYSNIT